ncbi:hypothetical protein BU16DRAFT_390775 [Lophium mytilinum]|uniref:BTB domain-containing protein n=1 Tax=Lophium mytilinum TaxID=390894 RepID=A0A6A6QWU0_9PEZI|nr:hypothetical protein BU16DRAFT_390775 [Lophium mytilinum]
MATEDADQSSTAVVEIARNGNVILVVGPRERRLQVCSTVLKNASKYFNAMFGPHFSEGQDLRVARPKEVPMPEDDANVLEILCNIIHHRNDAVPETLSGTEVFDVAVAADKFDCVVAIKHASTLWLNPREIQDVIELGHLMATAYILDNAQAFSEITLAMMLRHKESYLPLADEELVPWRTFYLLEERRNHMRAELQQILLDGKIQFGTDDGPECSCSWSSRHSSAYMDLLQREGLEPLKMLSNMTVTEVLEKMERMNDPTIPREWKPCNYRWHRNPDLRIMRKSKLDIFKKGNHGLCIDCIRSSTTDEKQTCRIKH